MVILEFFMATAQKGFLIGRVAARTGLAVSAIRFYEEKGLVTSGRNAGGQRVFAGADIRRISFILVAQKLGFSLAEIKMQLALKSEHNVRVIIATKPIKMSLANLLACACAFKHRYFYFSYDLHVGGHTDKQTNKHNSSLYIVD